MSKDIGMGLGSSSFGDRGVTKRLDALAALGEVRGERLLDLGCADGTYTVHLAAGFERVDAVDIEPERLDDFRARLADHPEVAAKTTISLMSGEHLEFPDDSFDVVTTIEVLEHVADLGLTLDEIRRVLKPGGRLMLTSPNRYFPIETHGFVVGGKRRRPIHGPFLPWIKPLHDRWSDARAFTVDGLTETAAQHGLVYVGSTFIMPPFDRSRAGAFVRPVLDRLERSRLKFFGMALVMVFRK